MNKGIRILRCSDNSEWEMVLFRHTSIFISLSEAHWKHGSEVNDYFSVVLMVKLRWLIQNTLNPWCFCVNTSEVMRKWKHFYSGSLTLHLYQYMMEGFHFSHEDKYCRLNCYSLDSVLYGLNLSTVRPT